MHTEENLQVGAAIDSRSEFEKAYDNYCKILLSNKDILAYIMKICMEEYKDCTIQEIKDCIESVSVQTTGNTKERIEGMPTEDESVFGALIRYDILFKAKLPNQEVGEVGLFINLEAQNKDMSEYSIVTRGIYYASRLLARQKNSPEGFKNSDFANLKKVYSIWICIHHSKEKDNAVNMYSIEETCLGEEWKAPKDAYDLLSVIVLYPTKQWIQTEKYTYEDLLNLLNVLFVTNSSSEIKKHILSHDYGIMMTKKIEQEVDEMCNLSQGVKAEGIAIGVKKEKETQMNNLLSYIKKTMVQTNMSLEEVMNMFGLTPEVKQVVIQKFTEGK